MSRCLRAKGIWPALLLLVLLGSPVAAQLDPTFGTGGKTTTPNALEDWPVKSFLLPDGKILVLVDNGASASYYLTRYNADGTLDSNYGTQGRVTLPIPFIAPVELGRGISDAVRQSDGKIVLVGRDNGDGLVLRFNENGTLDASFSGDGIHRPNLDQSQGDELKRVLLQPDGKIVAAGAIRNAASSLTLIRYLPDGNLDPGFGDQGGFIVAPGNYGPLNGFARQSTGKLVVYGSGGFSNPDSRILRFNANGAPDGGFASPPIPDGPTKFLLLADDRMVVAGSKTKTDHLFRQHTDVNLRLYNADGAADSTFGTAGVASVDIANAFYDDVFALAQRGDGKIIVGARTFVPVNRKTPETFGLSMIKLSLGGQVEGRYLPTEAESTFGQVLIQPDNRIVAVSTGYGSNFARDLVLTRHLDVPLVDYHFQGTPYVFPAAGPTNAAKSYPAVFRPSTRVWYSTGTAPFGSFFGLSDDLPAAADYFADFNTELAVFRPSNGTWYIARTYEQAAQNFVAVQWGAAGDIPVPADYDGDGKADVAVFRPSNGVWYIRKSSDNAPIIFQWGLGGDKPAVGDFDGDGRADAAVFRPSTGIWYIFRSSDGQFAFLNWGLDGDVPVAEDYDGDGKTDAAVWRPSTGVWYVIRSSDNGFTFYYWGLPTDIATPGDYDGDRRIDFAVFRPSTVSWYLTFSASGTTAQFPFGLVGDVPLQGKY